MTLNKYVIPPSKCMITPGIKALTVEAGQTETFDAVSLLAKDTTGKNAVVNDIAKQCPGDKWSFRCAANNLNTPACKAGSLNCKVDFIKFDAVTGKITGTAPKGDKDVKYRCAVDQKWENGANKVIAFDLTVKKEAVKAPICKINPEAKDTSIDAGAGGPFPMVLNATTMKPVAAIGECAGSKFSMECTPKADYMKFDAATGIATAVNPKMLKVAVAHKCLFKHMFNDKLAAEKSLTYTMSVDPQAVKPVAPAVAACTINPAI
jgi:hypothetical protein